MFDKSEFKAALELSVAETPLLVEVVDVGVVWAGDGVEVGYVFIPTVPGATAVWLALHHHQMPPIMTTATTIHMAAFAPLDILIIDG